jgi:probable F420-dependent oxidoreductase
MEVGVRLPSSGPEASPENIVTVARWAEQLGYHAVWVSDHVVLPEKVESHYPYSPDSRWTLPADRNYMGPLLTLAWAGAVAPSVKLGTAILVAPLRNPVLLAKRVSTLDYLSGGRVILGLGAGWMREEFELLDAPFVGRGKRVVEMVQLMRELWTGETVDFQGESWQIAGCKMHPRPAQKTIPVVWGGHSDAALRRVAQAGDGWLPTEIAIGQVTEGLKKLRKYCEQYDRDPASVSVIVRPDNYDPETLARYSDLAIEQMVLSPPFTGPNLGACCEEMQRIAEICDLQPRGGTG